MRKYTIILEPDTEEGGYTGTVPALPGCITQGETVEQCIERAHEAITGFIESLEADGEPIPEEIEPPQVITVHGSESPCLSSCLLYTFYKPIL